LRRVNPAAAERRYQKGPIDKSFRASLTEAADLRRGITMTATEVERVALMQTSRDWAKASATGDVDRIAFFWAEDAIVMPPDQSALVGKRAIRQYVSQSLAIPGFSFTWEPEQAVIAAGGDIGYMIERSRFTFVDATGTLRTQNGKTVTVWRRDAAGQWKCVVDIWNGNPSAQVLPTSA
jgi:ketosteroid isomerase-like protein